MNWFVTARHVCFCWWGTGHLSLKLMMRWESWCQTELTAVTECCTAAAWLWLKDWTSVWALVNCNCACIYVNVCVFTLVCVQAPLYLARGIPQKVIITVEHEERDWYAKLFFGSCSCMQMSSVSIRFIHKRPLFCPFHQPSQEERKGALQGKSKGKN